MGTLMLIPPPHRAVLSMCVACGMPEERDLFHARALLQVLSSATPKTSYRQLESARTLLKLLSGQTPVLPLDNAMELLLIALGKGSGELFDTVREEYAVALSRDASFESLLDHIPSVFLGRGGGGGGLGNLLGSLLGGMSG
jgi:hypothetical protein